MDFIAIDVETASAAPDSICQIGLAYFRNGAVVKTWGRYIDPRCAFDIMNVSIHGIDETTVAGSPPIEAVIPAFCGFLEGKIVASHTSFDRVALDKSSISRGLPTIDCRWIDTARVARRTWTSAEVGGYGLANLCKLIGHEFDHHDAVADAIACGTVFAAACAASGLSAERWLDVVEVPVERVLSGSFEKTMAAAGNPSGTLYGNAIVFTGTLTISRTQAADMAAHAGCRVMTQVGRQTTLVVVGDQDLRVLQGHEKSSKHRKAEELIATGQEIRIMGEEEFLLLIGQIADC